MINVEEFNNTISKQIEKELEKRFPHKNYKKIKKNTFNNFNESWLVSLSKQDNKYILSLNEQTRPSGDIKYYLSINIPEDYEYTDEANTKIINIFSKRIEGCKNN